MTRAPFHFITKAASLDLPSPWRAHLSEDHRPLLAVVSFDVRRDLVAPMRHLERLRLVHFYRRAPYHDLGREDIDDSLVHYVHPLDLLVKLWRSHPDIVQGVEPFALSLLPYQCVIGAYALVRRIPLYAGVHIGRPLPEKYGLWPARLLKLTLRPYLRLGYALFFYVNDGARRNLLWMGVPEEKCVRHLYGTWGVDLEEFSPEPDGREPDRKGRLTLLFVGRLHEEKGIFDLIPAYDLLRRKRSDLDLELVLIGDGPGRREAEALVDQLGVGSSVRFLGAIQHRDLPSHFRAATVFVSPSRKTQRWEEYVGAVNLQAMACGVPVVSTNTGAVPELVPDEVAGLLVSERDPEALAAAIERLLDDGALRRRMGAAGRALASRRYDAAANVRRAESILLERFAR